MSENATSKDGPRRTITLERSYSATVEAVWALWTTERGIESRAIDVADFKEEAVMERIDVIRARDQRTQIESAIGERRA